MRSRTMRAYRLFQANPTHPGIQFKKPEGEENLYSVRIGLGYRALAVMKEDCLTWYWIGNHSACDRLIQSFSLTLLNSYVILWLRIRRPPYDH
jgi:hypothetical protein